MKFLTYLGTSVTLLGLEISCELLFVKESKKGDEMMKKRYLVLAVLAVLLAFPIVGSAKKKDEYKMEIKTKDRDIIILVENYLKTLTDETNKVTWKWLDLAEAIHCPDEGCRSGVIYGQGDVHDCPRCGGKGLLYPRRGSPQRVRKNKKS